VSHLTNPFLSFSAAACGPCARRNLNYSMIELHRLFTEFIDDIWEYGNRLLDY
jgi:hypothetical protein